VSIWDASRTSRQRNFDGFADAGTEPPEITFAAAPIGVAVAFVHIIHRDWETEMVAATINRPRQRGSSAPAPGSKDRLQPAFPRKAPAVSAVFAGNFQRRTALSPQKLSIVGGLANEITAGQRPASPLIDESAKIPRCMAGETVSGRKGITVSH
jgi:hypothetical protein